MNKGIVLKDSNKIGDVIERYTSNFRIGNTIIVSNEEALIDQVILLDLNETRTDSIKHYEKLILQFNCVLPNIVKSFNIRAIVRNIEQRSILEFYSGAKSDFLINEKGQYLVTLDMGEIKLNTGKYSITLVLLNKEGDYVYFRLDNAIEFVVKSEYTSWSDQNVLGNWKLT